MQHWLGRVVEQGAPSPTVQAEFFDWIGGGLQKIGESCSSDMPLLYLRQRLSAPRSQLTPIHLGQCFSKSTRNEGMKTQIPVLLVRFHIIRQSENTLLSRQWWKNDSRFLNSRIVIWRSSIAMTQYNTCERQDHQVKRNFGSAHFLKSSS